MGSGSFTLSSFSDYSTRSGKFYDSSTNRVVGQTYTVRALNESLNPKGVIRECCNSDEHPNTIPVILALDVTGSMGRACKETAEALGLIMEDLRNLSPDVEVCVMGIGDLDYDDAPIQMSQFEADTRIAEHLDKIYMEHGGGGNGYESYTAAWYMGLKHCKLDCWNDGRKGIIITMGDEPLNPSLPKRRLNQVTGDGNEKSVDTNELYRDACEKFDIYHIATDDSASSFSHYKKRIEESFGTLLKENYKVSTIQNLRKTISDCVSNSISCGGFFGLITEDGSEEDKVNAYEISW